MQSGQNWETPTALRKLAVVGPFPPIRSGIAKHTAAFARALQGRADIDLRCWGFSKQYPALLYPGSSERGESAPDGTLDVQECIHGANPLTWVAAARDIAAWKPNMVIVPVWTFATAPALGWISGKLSAGGARVCTVVHNAFDHEASTWKDRLTTWQLSKADRFVTHNAALAEKITSRFPESPIVVFPHPAFDDVPHGRGRLPKRSQLELLFFGLVRPYKGLDVILDAISDLERDDVSLTIAGEFWGGLEDTMARIGELSNKAQIELVARYVGDDEMAEFFQRADAVVLPYRAVSGSGVVSLALHYGKPIIASDLPGFAEIVSATKSGWLFKTGDAADLAATLNNLTPQDLISSGQAASEAAKSLTWDRFADAILGEDEAVGEAA